MYSETYCIKLEWIERKKKYANGKIVPEKCFSFVKKEDYSNCTHFQGNEYINGKNCSFHFIIFIKNILIFEEETIKANQNQ